jgi:hypothetical protein
VQTDLKIDIPTLEPDPVLLAQLAQLSATSAVPRGGGNPIRALMAAATVVVVGGLSWLTGTLPGVASPFHSDPVKPAPRHAPAEPGGDGVPSDHSVVPTAPPIVPPGLAEAHPNNGNHYGQTKPHQNNGNHTGQTKPHQNNGNHTGQTRPHQNNSNQTGQTRPNEDNGNANGQVK